MTVKAVEPDMSGRALLDMTVVELATEAAVSNDRGPVSVAVCTSCCADGDADIRDTVIELAAYVWL